MENEPAACQEASSSQLSIIITKHPTQTTYEGRIYFALVLEVQENGTCRGLAPMRAVTSWWTAVIRIIRNCRPHPKIGAQRAGARPDPFITSSPGHILSDTRTSH